MSIAMLTLECDAKGEDIYGCKLYIRAMRENMLFNYNGLWFLMCNTPVFNNNNELVVVAHNVMPTLTVPVKPMLDLSDDDIMGMAQDYLDRNYGNNAHRYANQNMFTFEQRVELSRAFVEVYKNVLMAKLEG